MDTVYRPSDRFPIAHAGESLPARAKIMIKDRLKYQAYIGLDYFKNYEAFIINSLEEEYLLVNAKVEPKNRRSL